MYEVIADGIPWADSEGTEIWPEREAVSLAGTLERMGYDVSLASVGGQGEETFTCPVHGYQGYTDVCGDCWAGDDAWHYGERRPA